MIGDKPDKKPTEKPKGKEEQSKKKDTGVKRKVPKVTFKKAVPKALYDKKRWKGVRDVYMCVECEHCEDLEDDMKLHVLKHFPKEEREKQLDLMMR